jgi:hypothetical protein
MSLVRPGLPACGANALTCLQFTLATNWTKRHRKISLDKIERFTVEAGDQFRNLHGSGRRLYGFSPPLRMY